MKKLIKVIAGVLLFTMAFTACGQNKQPVSKDDNSIKQEDGVKSTSDEKQASGLQYPSDSEKVELRMSWWGSDNRHEAIENVIKLYTAKHPNVTISPEYGPWDGWTQKVLTQLSGKTETDIVQINYNWVHSFGKGKNVFYDLNELKDFIDLSNWDDTNLNALTVGGEVAAVPHGVTARAHLYNKALFEESGIAYPTTYDDLIAAGKIIGKDNTPSGAENKYALTNIHENCKDLFIAQMLFDTTGKIMQENGKVNYTVEEVTTVFDKYKEFEDSGAMPNFDQDDPLQNESNPVWTSGRSGSIYEWVGTMDKYLNSYKGGEAKEEIAVAPYIVPNAGDNIKVFVKPSLGYSVSKNSKYPQVAADFINFMFTDPEAVKALGTSLGVSSNTVSREIQEQENMITGAMKDGYDLLGKYEQVVLDPYFEDENVRGERLSAIEAFRTGKVTTAEAAKQYIDKQQAKLDKIYK